MIKRSLLVALVVAQLAPVCVGISWKGKEIAPRLVAVSGANRGVGIGIVRQVCKTEQSRTVRTRSIAAHAIAFRGGGLVVRRSAHWMRVSPIHACAAPCP